jgi:hypothetical protein
MAWTDISTPHTSVWCGAYLITKVNHNFNFESDFYIVLKIILECIGDFIGHERIGGVHAPNRNF